MQSLLAALQQTQTVALIAGLMILFLWESLSPFYAFFDKSLKKRDQHALRNLIIGGLNAVLVSVLFVGACSVRITDVCGGTISSRKYLPAGKSGSCYTCGYRYTCHASGTPFPLAA